ncbi:MAG: hypothetical protein KW788_02015 [Candidatus Doudnabacteria bacterium]|nr:hypothetical protein [Candidatus Doudnabacteria bacterium]
MAFSPDRQERLRRIIEAHLDDDPWDASLEPTRRNSMAGFANYTGGHISDETLGYYADGLLTPDEFDKTRAHIKHCVPCEWKMHNYEEYLDIDSAKRKFHWTNQQLS